jgi:hypothetical protein
MSQRAARPSFHVHDKLNIPPRREEESIEWERHLAIRQRGSVCPENLLQ